MLRRFLMYIRCGLYRRDSPPRSQYISKSLKRKNRYCIILIFVLHFLFKSPVTKIIWIEHAIKAQRKNKWRRGKIPAKRGLKDHNISKIHRAHLAWGRLALDPKDIPARLSFGLQFAISPSIRHTSAVPENNELWQVKGRVKVPAYYFPWTKDNKIAIKNLQRNFQFFK